MGCMEQPFAMFHNLNFGFGSAGGCVKIEGLSKMSDEKVQNVIDKIHAKYTSLQCQFLQIDDVNEYDMIYIGTLPPKIKRCDDNEDIHKLLVEVLNFKFKLLNDYGLNSDEDIKNNDYNIENIQPLYYRLICNDCLISCYHHSIMDGLSGESIIKDMICLLNDDYKNFNDEQIKYTKLEDCIDAKYAVKPASLMAQMMKSIVPTSWLSSFIQFYANNTFLSEYNPLSIHNDDLLSIKYIFNEKNNILSFPLTGSYNKWDWRMDYEFMKIPKDITLAVKQQCKLHGVHMSSLLQYITNASMIEINSNILNKDYYKTIIGNTFSTVPLYSANSLNNKDNVYLGCHVGRWINIVEYSKNIKINDDVFWTEVKKISKQILSLNVQNYYKNRFPKQINPKNGLYDTFLNKNGLIGTKSVQCPTITNPGRKKLNKQHYKHKVIEYYGSSNPVIGFGGVYMLTSCTIEGIDEMNLCLAFGKQFMNKNKAVKFLNKIKQKMSSIAAVSNLKSKL